MHLLPPTSPAATYTVAARPTYEHTHSSCLRAPVLLCACHGLVKLQKLSQWMAARQLWPAHQGPQPVLKLTAPPAHARQRTEGPLHNCVNCYAVAYATVYAPPSRFRAVMCACLSSAHSCRGPCAHMRNAGCMAAACLQELCLQTTKNRVYKPTGPAVPCAVLGLPVLPVCA